MSGTNQVLFVDTESELASLVRKLGEQDFVALDTEFVRERTYYPKLCLIQLANDEVTACVDPLAIQDLSPLLEVFENPRTTKVLHAARQDLEVIFQALSIVPTPIFDTQMASGLLGHDVQIGYAALVESILDVGLSKAHTRTDWSQRPLEAEQLRYAADDVRYLVPLYNAMHDTLQQRGRLAWLQHDVEALIDPKLYDTDPEHAWTRIKGARKLDSRQLEALKGACAWREKRAIRKDKPRQWIIKNAVLLEFARTLPQTEAALAALPGMPSFVIRHCGEELLEISTRAMGLEASPAEQSQRLSGEEKERLAAMTAILEQRSSEQQIHPSLLATRRDLEALLRGSRELAVLRDWRWEVVGKDLAALVGSEAG